MTSFESLSFMMLEVISVVLVSSIILPPCLFQSGVKFWHLYLRLHSLQHYDVTFLVEQVPESNKLENSCSSDSFRLCQGKVALITTESSCNI